MRRNVKFTPLSSDICVEMKPGLSRARSSDRAPHLISTWVLGPATARAPASDSVMLAVTIATVKLVGVAEIIGKVPLRADVVQPVVVTGVPAPWFGRVLKPLTAWNVATSDRTVTLVIVPQSSIDAAS